jgi:NADH dehydrogenase (ubiquinone) Fe-S protein 8
MYPSEDDEEGDEDDDFDDGFDPLSLGREKAGGGIRGKRVKLGKLIVHDEGLKMLDLVVAANMGIWWTIWDR